MNHEYMGHYPDIKESCYITPGVHIIGRVELGENVSVWYNTVIRGDVDRITIGARTNIQDNCVLHPDEGHPVLIGRDVTIAHSVILHGCTVEDGALIGMGSIVLNGAVIGAGAVLGAGSLITEGQKIPPKTLALGSPAKVTRELTPEEIEKYSEASHHYMKLSQGQFR